MKKVLKGIIITILGVALLFVLLTVLLYFPPVQNFVVHQVASYASRKTGMDISVHRVNLVFPLDLGIDGVKIIQQNDSVPQEKDTVADIDRTIADVQLMPLFHGRVMVDELSFRRMKVNTTNFIHQARIRGNIGKLQLRSHGIDLDMKHVNVNHCEISDADIDVALSDTVPPDTTPNTNHWKINIHRFHAHHTLFTLHLPGDSMRVTATFGDLTAHEGYMDLFRSLYSAGSLNWQRGSLRMDRPFEVYAQGNGLDFNHLFLDNMAFDARQFRYVSDSLNIQVLESHFKEQKSGIIIRSFKGSLALDSLKFRMPDLYLLTPESELQVRINMDLNAFADHHPGILDASLHGSFGKQDLMRFMGQMPVTFRRLWPNYPLSVQGSLRGNGRYALFSGLTVTLPTAFHLHANGYLASLTDMKRFRAKVRLDAHTYQIRFLTALLDPSITAKVNIPDDIGIQGLFTVDGKQIGGDFMASQGGGSLRAKGAINVSRMSYHASLVARNLPLQHFIPHQGLHPFSGDIVATGKGTDIYSSHTSLKARARVLKCTFGGYDFSGIMGHAVLSGGRIHAYVDSHNPLLIGTIDLRGRTSIQPIEASVNADLSKIDLYHLKIADTPITAGFKGEVHLATDQRDYIMTKGLVSNLVFSNGKKTYRPENINLDILSHRDSTHALVDCGNFHLNMDGRGGYKQLLSQVRYLKKEALKQFEARHIDQKSLYHRFPSVHVYMTSGNDNFFYHVLEHYGYHFKSVEMDLTSSPVRGLNGYMDLDSLAFNKVRLDTIQALVNTENDVIGYRLKVANNKNNPQYTFKALASGNLTEQGSDIRTKLYDEKGRLGIDAGLSALMEQHGIRIRLTDTHPLLGYRHFTANEDNFVFLGDNRRISANMVLKGPDGTGAQLLSNDDNAEALQDLTLSLNHLQLEKLFRILPYTPDLSGVMDGDFHVIQTKDQLSVSSDIDVKNMIYDKCPMGDIGTEFVYVPKEDGSHQVNGILLKDGQQVATIDGTYHSQGEGYLDAKLGLEKAPLQLLNGFIPEQLFGFKGYGEGNLTVKGTLSKPVVDGEVYLDSSYIYSEPYGVSMRFANDPVRIVGSHLLFENFEMFAYNNSPLDISGDFDFSDLNRMLLNIRMRAHNFELINAKENPRSTAYGKAFVDFFGSMNGPVDNLKMRGMVNVLGATDMTYILRESELTTDNELDELVKFTDFKDSTATVINRPKPQGLDMTLGIKVDESAHILCSLNAIHSNYIDLEGGGDLTMTYNPLDHLRLTGKYTLNNGEMKYSLPVIPLKTFTIQNGSFIQFTGDPMDPKLNITATEPVTASVSEGKDLGRSVNFVCGVQLSQTLQKMGIQFVISAPSDIALQDELNTMSIEERGKIAVTMLATGMYMTNGNTSKFTMNSALSSFLNSEINMIAGNATRSLGLDLGMTVNNSTNSAGELHTDYNFKFSKRLWNNRLSFIVGGQLSSGAEIDQNRRNDSFFNNVELQYRLNQNSSQYLRAYYNNNYYDWLEGQIGEYGFGFTWKRKLQHFKDIFNFKSDSPVIGPFVRNAKNGAKVVKKDSAANQEKP
jgi:hypothetical protein